MFCYSTNGHYASQSMQQPQSPYMGVNNLPGSGYNKGQYNAGHHQRAPIYDGQNTKDITIFSKYKNDKRNEKK